MSLNTRDPVIFLHVWNIESPKATDCDMFGYTPPMFWQLEKTPPPVVFPQNFTFLPPLKPVSVV
jgi:hypothetical protein